jgi:hypothetical protein
MRSVIGPVQVAVCLAIGLAAGARGCKRDAKPPPPPTPEQIKTGIEQSAERVRNDPNLTRQQKEQALRLLEGIAASAQQQRRRRDEQ